MIEERLTLNFPALELLRTMAVAASLTREEFDADDDHVLRMSKPDGGEWTFHTVADIEDALHEAEAMAAA